jgi:hypothetical protein
MVRAFFNPFHFLPMSEQLTSSSAVSTVTGPLTYNSIIRLVASTGKCWGPKEQPSPTSEYYPTLASTAIPLMLLSTSQANGQVRHGDLLKIQTLENGVDGYNCLGAWTTPSLYYYTNSSEYNQLNWNIYKVGGNAGDPIACGDHFFFVNQYYADKGAITANGEYLTSTPTSDGTYLTFTVQEAPITSGAPVNSGTTLHLFLQDGSAIGPFDNGAEYYPTLGGSAVPMTADIIGGSGVLKHGDKLYIKTQEGGAGAYNILSAYSTPDLYYYEYKGADEPNQYWYIQKYDTSQDDIIHYGDAFYLANVYYTNAPYMSPNGKYLTSTNAKNYFWYFLPA